MASGPDKLYTVRTPDGLELGPVRPETIVDLIFNRKLIGNESVSPEGGAWMPIQEVAAFKRAFDDRNSGAARQMSTDLDDLDEGSNGGGQSISIEIDDPMAIKKPAGKKAPDRIDMSAVDDALEGTITPPPPAGANHAQSTPLDDLEEIPEEEIIEDIEPIEELEEVETIELEPLQPKKPVAAAKPATATKPVAAAKPAVAPAAKKPAATPSAAKPVALDPAAAIRELTNPDNRYTIRDSDGLVLGPVRIGTIRDLMEAGKVTRSVEISKNGRAWSPIIQVPELLYLCEELKVK